MIAREELIKLWGGVPTPDEEAAFQEFARTYSVSEEDYLRNYQEWLDADNRSETVRALQYEDCDWTCTSAGSGEEEGHEGIFYVTVASSNKTWWTSYTSAVTGITFGRAVTIV
jgi:hypothetical protein